MGERCQATFITTFGPRHAGALAAAEESSVTINIATFMGNNATQSDGGAIYLEEGAKAYLDHVNLSHNMADDRGGAMASRLSGNLFIRNCSFRENTADNGGGLFIGPAMNGPVRIIASTFQGNLAGATISRVLPFFAPSSLGSRHFALESEEEVVSDCVEQVSYQKARRWDAQVHPTVANTSKPRN